MDQLLELLAKFCQIANIHPVINQNNSIEIYPIFLEAFQKGIISSYQFEQIKSLITN